MGRNCFVFFISGVGEIGLPCRKKKGFWTSKYIPCELAKNTFHWLGVLLYLLPPPFLFILQASFPRVAIDNISICNTFILFLVLFGLDLVHTALLKWISWWPNWRLFNEIPKLLTPGSWIPTSLPHWLLAPSWNSLCFSFLLQPHSCPLTFVSLSSLNPCPLDAMNVFGPQRFLFVPSLSSLLFVLIQPCVHWLQCWSPNMWNLPSWPLPTLSLCLLWHWWSTL